MDVNDLIFYLLDLAIFIMLVTWLRNSSEIVVETKVGAKWIIPALFLVVAVIGIFRYTGIFRIVQTACLILFALMYYNVKSGLSEKGIVMMGSITPWKKAGKITLNKNESCIIFKLRGREGALYFDPDELSDVRNFLATKANKDGTIK